MGRICARSGKVVVTTVGTRLGQPRVQRVEIGESTIEKRSGPGHVVHPDAHCDQIRTHGQRVRQLPDQQVDDASAADGEVGICQSGVVGVDDHGESIGVTGKPV